MSTKHYESSSSSTPIVLNSESSKWVKTNPRHPGLLFFADNITKANIVLRIPEESVKSLLQVLHVDVSELSPSRVTKIPELGITTADKNGNYLAPFDTLHLHVSGTGVHLSMEVLKHLKYHNWQSGKEYIEFTLSNWRATKPVFVIPRKGENIMHFFNNFKGFLEAKKNTLNKITNFRTRRGALTELINVLRVRLNKKSNNEFNMVQAEIIIRSMMMVDYANQRFELPHPSQEFEFVGLEQVITYRSLTSMLAYQNQRVALLNNTWCTQPQKTRHMLDNIINQ